MDRQLLDVSYIFFTLPFIYLFIYLFIYGKGIMIV